MNGDTHQQTCAQIREFYLHLGSEWRAFRTTEMARHERTATYLLCGAGLVEMTFDGQAWTDEASADFRATVSGLWIDMDRAILPDAIRDALPAWAGKRVCAQVGEEVRVRLTAFGAMTQADIREAWALDPHAACEELRAALLEQFLIDHARHPIKGRAIVRILSTRPTAPGAVPKDATVNDPMLAVLREMSNSQGAMAQALNVMASRPPASSSEDAAVAKGDDSAVGLAGITPCWRDAYLSYQRAILAPSGPPPEPLKGVWRWLRDHDPDPEYDLPDEDNWCRYVRACNQVLNPRPKAPRGSRAGRSVARHDEL